jgi:hypothetical protein
MCGRLDAGMMRAGSRATPCARLEPQIGYGSRIAVDHDQVIVEKAAGPGAGCGSTWIGGDRRFQIDHFKRSRAQ